MEAIHLSDYQYVEYINILGGSELGFFEPSRVLIWELFSLIFYFKELIVSLFYSGLSFNSRLPYFRYQISY